MKNTFKTLIFLAAFSSKAMLNEKPMNTYVDNTSMTAFRTSTASLENQFQKIRLNLLEEERNKFRELCIQKHKDQERIEDRKFIQILEQNNRKEIEYETFCVLEFQLTLAITQKAEIARVISEKTLQNEERKRTLMLSEEIRRFNKIEFLLQKMLSGATQKSVHHHWKDVTTSKKMRSEKIVQLIE